MIGLSKGLIPWSLALIFTVLMLTGTFFYVHITPTPMVDTSLVVPAFTEIDPYSGVLIVESNSGQGSCFVVDERDGFYYAITAAHVVDNDTGGYYDKPIFDSVYTVDEEEYVAEVVTIDRENDVAVIRFQSPEDYQIYSFGRAIAGEACVTIGWSDGSRLIYKGNVVSADLHGFVAANGGVVPGCSGGLLMNSDMEILGVTVQVSVYRGWAWDSTILYTPARFAEALLMTIED
ncbi:trypsin-like peptidase domain-containing protein [Candidatus Pacearchaeota archaeon]|nr:trypsin-like peptidase domain-containing protein [Candidatus Pacearchaeota archaeon]